MAFETILVENETKKEIVLAEYGVRELLAGSLNTLSDVTITNPQDLQFLQYNLPDNQWENVSITVPGAPVDSVFGRIGVVTAEAGDYDVSQITGALSAIVDDTSPELGGVLLLGGYEIHQPSGQDLALDVKGLATGDNFVIKSDTSEVLKLSFDSVNGEFILDLDNSGLSTRLIGLPNNPNPAPSEALSYQFLVDNGVLNPMVASLNASQNDVTDTNILFFGDSAAATSTGFGINAVASGAIPAVTSSQNAGFTIAPEENTVVIVPENGQHFILSGDGGSTATLRYPSLDGTTGQILATNGLGVADWVDNEGGLSAVVDDTSPQLGGNLDTNNSSIFDSVNARGVSFSSDIYLDPSAEFITFSPNVFNNTGIKFLNTSFASAASIYFNQQFDKLTIESSQEIILDSNKININNAYMLEDQDGASGQVLTTNGAGITSWVTAVNSVDGRTGDVTLDDLYANIVHTHTEADITNLDKYTQSEVDTHISDSMTAHVNAPDPHPQYLTVNDLPETLVSWYTNNVSAVDPAYLKVSAELPSEPESSIQATAVTQGVPILLGQWLREPEFTEPFTLFETTSTFQFDFDSSATNSEFYVEFWKLSSIGGVETLLATSDTYPLTSNRQTYTGTIIVPGPINIEVGDRTFTRIYINKNSGGTDPTVTLFMEGNGISRVVTTTPIATFPAPHASSHEVGGTDQISHDLIAGANGFDSHATIDSKILALETNAFLDGDTIDNGTY